jgi:hypothetical protein
LDEGNWQHSSANLEPIVSHKLKGPSGCGGPNGHTSEDIFQIVVVFLL